MQQSTRVTTVLGLNFAGVLFCFCGAGQRALDNIDQAFKAKYCDACPDRVPRPAGWTFYDEPY